MVPPNWFLVQLVLAAARRLRTPDAGLHIEIGCVKDVVADKFKPRAVKLIRSRAGHDIDHATRVHSILCAQRGRLHAELADCIGEGEWQIGARHVVAIVGAVQAPQGGLAHAAGDRDRNRSVGVLAARKIIARCRRGAA